MNSLTGSMIELNVHMEAKGYAVAMILIGVLMAILSGIFFLLELNESRKLRLTMLGYLISFIIALGLWLYGLKIPRDKIISYCANGPVSIEQISAAYDIVEIDGKLIRLKERR